LDCGKNLSLVLREDLHNPTVRLAASEFEDVSPSWQNSAGHFNRIAEGDNGFFVPLLCMSNRNEHKDDEQGEQVQCNNESATHFVSSV
jgi:hypothetical protein